MRGWPARILASSISRPVDEPPSSAPYEFAAGEILGVVMAGDRNGLAALARKLDQDVLHRYVAARCLGGERVFGHLRAGHADLLHNVSLKFPVGVRSGRARTEGHGLPGEFESGGAREAGGRSDGGKYRD